MKDKRFAPDPASLISHPANGGLPAWPTRLVRLLCIVVALGLWFLTQSLIGARAPLEDDENFAGVLISRHDAVFAATVHLNRALHENPRAADALLIVSSLIIDLSGVVLLSVAIFGRSLRPFAALFLVFALRQLCQAVCALPPPDGIIWRSPGFPTLLVTYGVGNDFFFSGHTAIAVLAAAELTRLNGRWWIALGIGIAAFEALTVLVLRAHYTLDVVTGILAALLVTGIAARVAPACDRAIEKLAGRLSPRAVPIL